MYKHQGTTLLTQTMSTLLEERVKIEPAFNKLGNDFAGHLYIKSNNSTAKAYLFIY
uniref:Uncharacterized protein n=1 Tax=Lepeophtheirus salmonis TaxID=72036 RepID=A0A0K2SZP8_LEPSM